jgi:hypothetical protein
MRRKIMSNENRVGRISLWQEAGEGGKPVMRGTIEIGEDVTYRVSLWNNTSDNEKAPQFTGELELPFVAAVGE